MLRSTTSARTYIGYSRNPARRLRQHNGELPGGAAPVKGRPWELVLVVSGFGSAHAALAFESAWQRPHTSRHCAREWHALRLPRCSVATSVSVRLQALAVLLVQGYWARDVLTVHVVRTHRMWEAHLARVRTVASVWKIGWP